SLVFLQERRPRSLVLGLGAFEFFRVFDGAQIRLHRIERLRILRVLFWNELQLLVYLRRLFWRKNPVDDRNRWVVSRTCRVNVAYKRRSWRAWVEVLAKHRGSTARSCDFRNVG